MPLVLFSSCYCCCLFYNFSFCCILYFVHCSGLGSPVLSCPSFPFLSHSFHLVSSINKGHAHAQYSTVLTTYQLACPSIHCPTTVQWENQYRPVASDKTGPHSASILQYLWPEPPVPPRSRRSKACFASPCLGNQSHPNKAIVPPAKCLGNSSALASSFVRPSTYTRLDTAGAPKPGFCNKIPAYDNRASPLNARSSIGHRHHDQNSISTICCLFRS
ncbi:hypothetical protein F4824DRAFT_336085 [Ustulina deusta]|nr:hypothetical protein F4823DRAFT_497645 [Ustulina deusta]KAI3330520.1 hypothetical protein F4824DRAFT_336085 [Ustulina deusta]